MFVLATHMITFYSAFCVTGACSDWNDNTVMDGDLYTPADEDLCLKCTCDSGHPINCRTEDCSPPKCQNYVRHKGECCQFTCLQDSNNQDATNEEKTESSMYHLFYF